MDREMLPTRCYISHGAWCWGACSTAGGSTLPALNRKRGRVNIISQKSKVRELHLCCQDERGQGQDECTTCLGTLSAAPTPGALLYSSLPSASFVPSSESTSPALTEEGQTASCVLVHSLGSLSHSLDHHAAFL